MTELTVRSKAYWGYDEAFLQNVKPELLFDPAKFLPEFHVYLMECEEQLIGFCSLIPMDEAEIELHDLFIEPFHIGLGNGKVLWVHAVNVARELGFKRIVLTADPHAEEFYMHQGARRVGEKVSPSQPSRRLPVMEYVISM